MTRWSRTSSCPRSSSARARSRPTARQQGSQCEPVPTQNRTSIVTSGAEGARPAPAGRAPAGSPPPSPDPSARPDGAGQLDGPVLRLQGIGKHFGPVEALTDINLDIPPGQVTALVGDNGAGKTTLIKCIAGIWPPSAG